jgi:peptidyl-prolyl cis-trans isomerase D
MLNTLRQQLDNKLIQGMLILLVLSFALWGVGDMLRTKKDNVVIKVGKIEYTISEWQNALDNQLRALQSQYGQQISPEVRNSPELRNHVLQQLINRALFKQEADKLKIIVNDEMAKMEVARMPAFHDEQGKFNAEKFSQILKNNNLTEKNFVEMLREDIAIDNLLTAFSSNKKNISQLTELLWQFVQSDRKMTIYKAKADAFKPQHQPDEKELAAVLQENIAQFTVPEQRKGNYFVITRANVRVNENIDEQNLVDLYNSRQFLFKEPEQRHVMQLILKDQAEAEKVVNELASGADFSALAKKYNKENKYKVDLGFINHAELPEQIAAAIGSLQAGQHTAPQQSPFGWHIFWVKELKAERTAPFAEVRERVKKIYLNEALSLELAKLTQEIEQALANGKSFQDVAKEHNLAVHAVTMNTGSKQDPSLAKNGIVNFDEFKKQLFKLANGVSSPSAPTGNNKNGESYFIVQATEIIPAREQNLPEVQEQIKIIWQNNKQQRELVEFTNELSAALAGSNPESWEKFKEENKGKFTIATNVLLHNALKEQSYSQNVIKQLMDLTEGMISLPMVDEKGEHFVAKIEDIVLPKEKITQEQLSSINNALAQMDNQIIISQYLSVLQKNYNIEINHDALKK